MEYLGHTLSSQGISKEKKVNAVRKMPRPHNLSTLKSFLGSVQFYGKFLPNLSTITGVVINRHSRHSTSIVGIVQA